MTPVFLDFETRSMVDVRKTGGWAYVADASTEVLCGAAILPDGARHVWSRWPFLEPQGAIRHVGEEIPAPVLDAARRSGAAAHNAEGFDRLVWEALGGPAVLWHDTAHCSAQRGLPRKLETVAQEILGEGKDPAGARLICIASKPHRGALRDPVPAVMTPLVRYCLRDAALLAQLWAREGFDTPHPDAAIVALDSRINRRGVKIDFEWVAELEAAAAEGQAAALAECAALGVAVEDLRSTAKVRAALAALGAWVPDCQAGTLEPLLTHPDSRIVTLVTGRLAVARVLAGKLAALRRYSVAGRLHGAFLYHSAHTGRWGAKGPQLHNLPRVQKGFGGLRPAAALERAREKGVPAAAALGALIRGALIPSNPALRFISADYSQVEARGVLWHAEDPRLEEFLTGDPYLPEASRIFNAPITDKADPRRQVGKVAILSLGYGGGSNALERMAAAQRIDLSQLDPQAIVEAWRDGHTSVAGRRTGGAFQREDGSYIVARRGGWWQSLKRAIRRVLADGGSARAGRVTYERDGGHLVLHLPSGRPIVYRKATLAKLVPPWGGEPKWHPVWQSPRGVRKLWHGLAAENCWSGDTLVVTCHGPQPISSVRAGTLVWDGVEFVRTAGAVSRGDQEVGEWAGQRVTPEHRILAGSEWIALTDLGVSSLHTALATGRRSAEILSYQAALGWLHARSCAAWDAALRARSKPSNSLETRAGAGLASSASPLRMPWSSPTHRCEHCGFIATAVSFPGATTPGTRLIRITEAGGSASSPPGGETGWRSCATPSHSPAGTIFSSISTGLTTPGATFPATSACVAGARTAAIGAGPCGSATRGSTTPTRSGVQSSSLGGAPTPPAIISPEGAPPSGLWIATGERTEVWDLLDCGPRERFLVLTDLGPVLAHNCVQATCRDLLCAAMLRLEDAGYPVAIHVHDSVTVEAPPGSGEAVAALMCVPPPWAAGFPLAVDVSESERFLK